MDLNETLRYLLPNIDDEQCAEADDAEFPLRVKAEGDVLPAASGRVNLDQAAFDDVSGEDGVHAPLVAVHFGQEVVGREDASATAEGKDGLVAQVEGGKLHFGLHVLESGIV
jgi:hypothetical protein